MAIAIWDQVPDPAGRVGADLAELFQRAAEAALMHDRSVHPTSTMRSQRALDLTEAALDHLDSDRERGRAAMLHARLGDFRWQAGQEGAGHAAEALRLLARGPDSVERVNTLISCAEGLLKALRYNEAAAPAEAALDGALRLRNAGLKVGLNHGGHRGGLLGDVSTATAELHRAAALAEQVGAGPDLLLAKIRLWSVLLANDRPDEALALHADIARAARRYGLADHVGPIHLVHEAMQLHGLGRWTTARPFSRTSIGTTRGVGAAHPADDDGVGPR